MKLGLTTDSLAGLSCDEMLATCERLGLQAIELGCGAWSSAPHIDVDALLASDAKCKEYLDKVASHGLTIAALNCSGNQLDPGVRGPKHDAEIRKTFQLAEKLGIQRVVMMSGLPGGQPGDRTPSWILTHYPPECHEILKYQWEVCVNWWRDFVPFARDCGVRKIALEPHGWQLVYNVQNLRTLRAALGGCDDRLQHGSEPPVLDGRRPHPDDPRTEGRYFLCASQGRTYQCGSGGAQYNVRQQAGRADVRPFLEFCHPRKRAR